MNRVVTTDASITAGQPIVANAGLGTLPFIQDSFQEAMSSFIKGVIGSYTANDLIVFIDPLIVISGGGNTATWTAGAIFYNDEIYTIPAGTLTKAGGAVFLYVITDVQSPIIDPVYFKDGNQYGPHRVRQITISSGTSGTGIADYGAVTVKTTIAANAPKPSWTAIALINGWVAVAGLSPYYRKWPNGEVEFKGLIQGSASTNVIFASLPSGYRPTSSLKTFTGFCSANSPKAEVVSVTSGGDVECQFYTPGTTAQISLDSVRFNIDS
jgi:hypothetical protein